MGIFKRRKDDEAFKIQLEREALDRMNGTNTDSDLSLPLSSQRDDSAWNIRGNVAAPHTITAEELNGATPPATNQTPGATVKVNNIPMSATTETESASSFLYKKMTEARKQSLETVVTVEPEQETSNISVPATQVSEAQKPDTAPTQEIPEKSQELNIDEMIRSLREMTNSELDKENPQTTLSNDDKTISPHTTESKVVLENTKNNTDIPPAVDPQKAKLAEERRTSLLARCNAFLEDDEVGTVKIDTEKYKLESVESILKDFEERASQRAMKTFNQTTPKPKSDIPQATTLNDNQKTEQNIEKTTVFSAIDTKEELDKTQVVELDLNQNDNPKPVKHYFTAPVQPKRNQTADVDATRVMSDVDVEKIALTSTISSEKTSIFDALNIPKPEEKIDIKNFEPKENISKPIEEQQTPQIDDYNSIDDKSRVMGELISKRKNASIKSVINLLLLIPAILLLTPLVASLTAINPIFPFVLEFVVLVIAMITNFDSVKSILSVFNNNPKEKAASGFAILGVLLFSVVQLISKRDFISLSALILISFLFNSLSDRNYFNVAIYNFDLIANPNRKKAVAIIKNKTATESIVGNSIDGGSLVCCGADTINIKNFLKYTYCNNPSSKKIKNVTVFGLVLSIIILILILLFTDIEIALALSYFCISLCITASPVTLLTSRLPFKIANSRLKLYDAMLTGYRAADELDLCNGVAVSCTDLFPEGSIRLVDMKLLSPNPIDQSMIDAAALADAIGSPIAGIFKQVSTASSYTQKPLKVDSFVYEDKMGISGWVDDRRVFVGNRVLMEAHGFTNLPPIELDKKIMRKGYFPVYLVSDNVPCALLIVKYAPDEEIAYELRRLCNTGTTVLIHNCDPNISEQMICDYFGLYSESVYVMSKQGSLAFENISKTRKDVSAGAAYKGNVCGLFANLTASINIKRSIAVMTALYVAFVVLGLFALAVLIFTPTLSSINSVVAIVFQLITTLIVCLPPLFKRP